MELDFEDKKLAKDCLDERSRIRVFGRERAKKLANRLTVLRAASNLEQLRHAPGRFHELRGDRAGQFAADLDGPYRLIFQPVLTPQEEPIHASGFVWSRITRITILEITDYHG